MTYTVKIPQVLGLLLAVSLALAGCGCISQGSEETQSGTGTVTFVDLEGGFYGIIADNGEKYYPLNLEDAYKKDGLSVRYHALVKEDVSTVQMWGTPIEITDITVLSPPLTNVTLDGVTKTGTVEFVDLEGGFYGIVADDGTKYYPLNLDEKYRVDGRRVSFHAEPAENTGTIQMWGTPVEITSITPLSSSPQDEVTGKGTIQYIDLEGGFYGIVTDGGEQYLPLNLESAYQKNGIAVTFKGQLQEGTVTTQMWGTPLQITEIEQINA
ncbi:MAG TPA: DUF333 domain-containing protein, partial [Methanomicrobiales archaeon]|nr:DUF333 domain-containing protein [Methanomicrobiales archaeon]